MITGTVIICIVFICFTSINYINSRKKLDEIKEMLQRVNKTLEESEEIHQKNIGRSNVIVAEFLCHIAKNKIDGLMERIIPGYDTLSDENKAIAKLTVTKIIYSLAREVTSKK